MDMDFKTRFIEKWNRYFNGSDLPVIFYYTNEEDHAELVSVPKDHQCIIGLLGKVRRGDSLCFNADSIGCGGGKRYLGYTQEMMPGFEYFLSCGIEGKIEGERYKKTPEIVTQLMNNAPLFEAPERFIVFKRWDKLQEEDNPDVVIFFAEADILSGLFTLAGFEEVDVDGVTVPFAAGCGSIVLYPYLEKSRSRPRAVIGMFDVSARPYVPKECLSFAVPIEKFMCMVEDMEESFLITPSWEKVRNRINS